MITLIGIQGCHNCKSIHIMLTQHDIRHNYVMLTDLSEEKKNEYIDKALKKNISTLPIILDDQENIINVEEVLNINE